MIRMRRRAGACLVAALAWAGAGCGGGSSPASQAEPPPQQIALSEVGEMFRLYLNEHHKPPRGGKDVARYAPAFSHGSMAVQNGDVIVFWGADLTPGSTAVLAHERDVPKTGGMVLLQDGETIKPMTVQEFQAAPKAGK
jgi:hypothetical protein